MRFARLVFGIAGTLGIVVIAPLFFLEQRIGTQMPPPINHPEYLYGFAGVALAWQVAFLVIASDPLRFRPLMLVGVLEKIGFGVPVAVLYARGRAPGLILGGGLFDLALGVLFVAAWWATRPRAADPVA